MKPPYQIETDAISPILCDSAEELDSILERLHREHLRKRPISVVVSQAGRVYGDGDEIGLGLGLDPTFILINVAPCDGEYYISAGDPAAKGDVIFYGAREHIVVERRNFVPWGSVRQAVREFVDDGLRSRLFRWNDCSGRDA
jgi:hypothetical protein